MPLTDEEVHWLKKEPILCPEHDNYGARKAAVMALRLDAENRRLREVIKKLECSSAFSYDENGNIESMYCPSCGIEWGEEK